MVEWITAAMRRVGCTLDEALSLYLAAHRIPPAGMA